MAGCAFIKSKERQKKNIVIEATDEVKDGVSCISEGRRKTCIDADDDSPNEDHHDDDDDDDDGSQLIAQRVEALGM